MCDVRSFGSKVGPRPYGWVAMGSAVLFILRYRLLLYSAGSRMNRIQAVLSGFRARLLWFVQAKLYVGMALCISWLHLCLCV